MLIEFKERLNGIYLRGLIQVKELCGALKKKQKKENAQENLETTWRAPRVQAPRVQGSSWEAQGANHNIFL